MHFLTSVVMENNKTGRRSFLRSTVCAGLGVAGGIAASETVAAKDNSHEIRISSTGNYWEYQIITMQQYNDIKKGNKADGDDYTDGLGNYILGGQVSQGGVDNFWMEPGDAVHTIRITYNDYGWMKITVAKPANYYQALGVERDRDFRAPGYSYIIDIDGDVKPHQDYFDHGQDSIDGSTFFGTVDPKDTDGVLRTGPPNHIFVEDPNSPGTGLEMYL